MYADMSPPGDRNAHLLLLSTLYDMMVCGVVRLILCSVKFTTFYCIFIFYFIFIFCSVLFLLGITFVLCA